MQPGVLGQIIRALKVIVSGGSNSGVFVYSGTPGAGDLVATMIAAGGLDPYGNAMQAGVTSYNTQFGSYAELDAGFLKLGTASDRLQMSDQGQTLLVSALTGNVIQGAWTLLFPSGDQTGVIDTHNINFFLTQGNVILAGGAPFWINGTIIIPSATSLFGPNAGPPGKPRSAPVNPTPPTIKMANGANLDAMISDGGWTSAVNPPPPSSAILMNGVVVDGNAANQTGGLGHGFVFLTRASSLVNCMAQNTRGAGFILTDQSKAGFNAASSLVENRIQSCVVYQAGSNGIWVQNFAARITDGYIENCIVDQNFVTTSGIGLLTENTVGLRIIRNHIYANTGTACRFLVCNTAWIIGNYADNFGQGGVSGTTYYGFDVSLSPFGNVTFRDNKASTQENAGAGKGTYVYYNIANNANGQVNDITFADNAIQQRSQTTAPGTSSAAAFNTLAGVNPSMTVHGVVGPFNIQGNPQTNPTPNTSPYPVVTGNVIFPDFRGTVTSYSPADPAGTASATLVMMGLGSTLTYTPAMTGKLKITLQFGLKNSVANNGATLGLRYNTGAAPANGVAVTGTVAGKDGGDTGGPGTVFAVGRTLTGIATGLVPGVPVWFDAALDSNGGVTTMSLVNVFAVIEEVA